MNADELTKLTTDAFDQRSTALTHGPGEWHNSGTAEALAEAVKLAFCGTVGRQS